MKKLFLLVLFASSIIAGQQVLAQTGKCEKEVDVKAGPVVPSRGKNTNIKVDKVNGQRIYLKDAKIKSRGRMPGCMISMANEADQDVDIYVDGVYIGSIKPQVQGVIESLERYEKVYCVSADKKLSWSQQGDCQCIYVYKLKN